MGKKKLKKKTDPFAAREAEKYTNPIASRELILSHLKTRGSPAILSDLAEELAINEDQYEALNRRIKAMLRDGQLEKLKGRRFWPSGENILVEGFVRIEKGKYKVVPTDGGARIDIINFNQMPIYSGAKVVVSIPKIPNEILRQGKIVDILEHTPKTITGRFIKDLGFNYVIPHSREFVHDILIPTGKSKRAKDGEIVAINLLTRESKWTEPVGEVIEVLGSENVKGIEVQSALTSFDIPYVWPKKINEIVKKLKEEVPAKAIAERQDLRNLPFVTIDGEDSKDFDDAVFCQARKSGGWRLFVAIADVSYYVKHNSHLDKEALKRGNSVYFPGQVVPMLPEILSNGLCSLKPKVDRLALVCEMTITAHGDVSRYKFYEAVIKSAERLTYTKVFNLLQEGKSSFTSKYQYILPHLQELQKVYFALRNQRESRGAIDFDTVETKIIFNKSGKIQRVEPVHRNEAHKIIEECMLAANAATAKFLKKNKIPSIFRIHEPPVAEKFVDLQKFLYEIGVKHKFGKDPEPLDYTKILQKIHDRPDANIIQMIMLRSLNQAVYSPDNIGHFGLAFTAYTHFTSPIRRYTDLIVHRQIKAILSGEWSSKEKANANKIEKMLEQLDEISQHCSSTERRADEASRDVVRWLKCQYMEQHLGKSFDGVIASVTRFGFFVQLNDIYVDGLVHVTGLRDDYYIFDGIHHKLIGEATGKEYKIGMAVNVTVAKVNLDDRKIDFELNASVDSNSKKSSRKTKKHAKKETRSEKNTSAKKRKKISASKNIREQRSAKENIGSVNGKKKSKQKLSKKSVVKMKKTKTTTTKSKKKTIRKNPN